MSLVNLGIDTAFTLAFDLGGNYNIGGLCGGNNFMPFTLAFDLGGNYNTVSWLYRSHNFGSFTLAFDLGGNYNWTGGRNTSSFPTFTLAFDLGGNYNNAPSRSLIWLGGFHSSL